MSNWGKAMDSLSLYELSRQAGCSDAQIANYVSAGLIKAQRGTFETGDVFRVRLIMALENAGVTVNDLAAMIADGLMSFDFAGQLMASPVILAEETSDHTLARFGIDRQLSDRLRRAAGQNMIDPSQPFRRDDVEVLQYVAQVRALGVSDDTLVNLYRLLTHALRRTVDGMRDLFRSEVEQALLDKGLNHREMMLQGAKVRTQLQEVGLRISQLLQRRFLEEAVFDNVIMRIQQVMQQAGRSPGSRGQEVTVAFADLAGYTAALQWLSDNQAHDLSRKLEQLAQDAAAAWHGRLIKMLGDGALMVFDTAAVALQASMALIERAEQEQLLPLRAGLATGPVVLRDGDVFGRTVNLAARIMSKSEPGHVLLDHATLQALPDALRRACGEAEQVSLKGFPEAVSVHRCLQLETVADAGAMVGGR